MIKFMDCLITSLDTNSFKKKHKHYSVSVKIKAVVMTSCHHGDAECQNNLSQAKQVMRCYNEIRVMEIDFVQVGEDFVSSHDYKAENIQQGSSLREWIDLVVLRAKKVLWIDLKSHVDVLTLACCCGGDIRFKFDCRQLFRVLAKLCNETKQHLQKRIWLSCQDSEVRDTLIRYNNKLKACHQWMIITDIPFVYSYACKYLLPFSSYECIHNYVFTHFITYDFSESPIICIDHSFFPSDNKIIQFIENSTILPGSTILLYTFTDRDHPPIKVLGYKIIMQFDYTPPVLVDTAAANKRKRRQPLNKAHSVYLSA